VEFFTEWGGNMNFTRVAFVPFFTYTRYYLVPAGLGWGAVGGYLTRLPVCRTVYCLLIAMLIASLIRYPIRSRARLPTGMSLIVSLISYPILPDCP